MKPWKPRKAGRRWACAFALWVVLLAGCAGCSGTPSIPPPTPSADSIRGIADEFKRLRAVVGHFDGGNWNDDVDRWMGRKHQLMIELGERLGMGAHSRAQVVDLLGTPDRIAHKGDPLYDQIRDRPEFEPPDGGADAFLVYHWRGEHDFMYLAVREEKVLGAGWWYAGE